MATEYIYNELNAEVEELRNEASSPHHIVVKLFVSELCPDNDQYGVFLNDQIERKRRNLCQQAGYKAYRKF